MSNGRICINASGGGYSNEDAAAKMVALGGAGCVVINEAKLLQLVMGAMKYPIFRMKDTVGIKDDDHAYEKHDAREFSTALWHLAPEGAFLYLGNEFGSDNLTKQDAWTARCIEVIMELNVQQYGADKKRYKRPASHAQFTQHPYGGAADLRQYRSSVQMTIQAGGIIIPHVYYWGTIEQELARKPRNGFTVLDEWRQVYGGGVALFCSEFGYAHKYNSHDGFMAHISQERYADDTALAAEIAEFYDAYLAVYGFFAPTSEWNLFNVLHMSTYLQRCAAWNRSNPVSQFPIPDLTPLHDATVTAASASGSNARQGASTAAPLVAGLTLRVGDNIRISQKSHINGGYQWHQFEKGGVKGYVARGSNAVFDFAPKAPVNPMPPIDGKVLIDVADFNRILELDSIVEDATRQRLQIMGRYLPG